MRNLVFFFIGLAFIFINLNAQAQPARKSAASYHPWQHVDISLRADKAWQKDKPNSNESNFSAWERSRAYYRAKAKKAIKEAREISASKKASPADTRPKTQRGYEKKYLREVDANGVNVRELRKRNS